jgi:hypothetical protein
MLRKQIVEI